jgi:hypothetical protein
MIHSYSRAERRERERDYRKNIGFAIINADVQTAGRDRVWFAGYEYENSALHVNACSLTVASIVLDTSLVQGNPTKSNKQFEKNEYKILINKQASLDLAKTKVFVPP